MHRSFAIVLLLTGCSEYDFERGTTPVAAERHEDAVREVGRRQRLVHDRAHEGPPSNAGVIPFNAWNIKEIGQDGALKQLSKSELLYGDS